MTEDICVNSPSISFSDDKDGWKRFKLSDLASMHARIGWQNLRTSEFLDDGDYLLITGTDFKDGKIDYSSCHYVSKDRFDQDPNIQLKNGSILITKDGTLGKVAFVDQLKFPATLNAGVFNVTKKAPDVDEKYLYQYLRAPFLMDYVTSKATGGTIKHLNQNILVDFTINKPDYEIQKKIGDFLSRLDEMISVQKQKCDSILRFKFGCLNKLFPAIGESEPQLRLRSDGKKWIYSRIDEICTFSKGSGYSKSDVSDEGEPLLLYGSLYTDYQTIIHTTKTVAAKRNDSVVSTGREVVIPASGETKEDIARASAIVSKGVMIGGDLNILVPKKELDPGFLAYSITYGPVNRQIVSKAQGATIVHLHSDAISQCMVAYPDISVQKQICSFLETIDNQILFETQIFNKLHDIKNALLQRMLI